MKGREMMNIQQVETFRTAVPLSKPFKTALRTVYVAEAVVVKITCDNGITGWGEAPPTLVITGDSLNSIECAVQQVFKPLLLNENLLNYEPLLQKINKSLVRNSSAKAAVDMAVYDCLARHSRQPLYQYLGGAKSELETDFTVSVNTPKEMGEDALLYMESGFNVLKVKVGKDAMATDIERIKEIRSRVGDAVEIRLDANQGWSAKEAVRGIRKMEDLGLKIELVEQPVAAHDIEGMKQVTDSVDTPIMADESIFTAEQALRVLKTRSADLINIKLMKAGGIFQAEKINSIAEAFGVECMVGSMIETRLGITAAAHFAASKSNITRFDFDAPLMLAEDIVTGGIIYNGRKITFPQSAGLGISHVQVKGGVSVE
jgi:L-alanine-DL-glutamate epimerase-like enolase superfamily enzyme